MNYQSGPYRGQQRGSPSRGNFAGRKRVKYDASQFIKSAKENEQIAYSPIHVFEDFGFDAKIIDNIKTKGYTEPTPIQDQAILSIMQGKDVIGIAQTGTGKTAAFLLPLFQKILSDSSQRAVIIVPTRELADQIYEEGRLLAKGLGIKAVVLIGGASMSQQIYGLRKNPQIVIATPGRLKDLEQQRHISLESFQTIVLDEVDRMLDMGFIRDIRYLISRFSTKRQSLFFSATLPPEIRILMDQFVFQPVTISIAATKSSDRVNQDVIYTNGRTKIDMLHELLVKPDFKKVLLFGRTKRGMDKLSRVLSERGFRVATIHGNKRQSQRVRAIQDFRQGNVPILLATDIASRGIDISDITHVINYELPESYDDYIHRIGRTGRANAFGQALTFID